MPDRPCPTVQPMAQTPPTPISVAPTRWLAVSSASRKPSQRKLRDSSAYTAEPATTPNTDTMPSVSTLLLSLKNISQSTV
jgi:hypothetical protein